MNRDADQTVAKIVGEEDSWTVESVGDEGEVFKTNFYGPLAEERARAFARPSTQYLLISHVESLQLKEE